MTMKIEQPAFGRRLRELRAQRGLSQRDVAAGTVNPSYISLLESGTRVPALEIAMHLARVLSVPLDTLVGDVALPMVSGRGETATRGDGDRLVSELLARAAIDFGDLGEAQCRFDEAYRAAMDAEDPIATLEYGLELLEILTLRSDYEARYELARALSVIAAEAQVPELIIRVRTDQAVAARDTGRLTEAGEEAGHALRDINGTRLQDTGEHVRLIAVLISVLSDMGDHAEIARLVDAMLLVAKKIDSAALSGRANWTASVAYARLGNQERAVEYLRYAHDMLANPGTPLRDWARFSRSAASLLLDSGADLAEAERNLISARAVLAVIDLPGEASLLASAELRYALASGDLDKARDVSRSIDETQLTGFELIRVRVARGRMLHLSGDTQAAVGVMRSAAELGESLGAYPVATKIWREIVDMR
jgi:transcriptional regulator with XRE-family HTH domain